MSDPNIPPVEETQPQPNLTTLYSGALMASVGGALLSAVSFKNGAPSPSVEDVAQEGEQR